MPMTENELADLDKLLLRMEKKAKAWTYARWMVIVLGLLILGCGAWLLLKLPDAWVAGLPKDVIAPVGGFELLWARHSAIYICLLLGSGLVQVVLGGIALTSSLCRWRKGQNDRLLVKMARAWLESQSPVLPDTP